MTSFIIKVIGVLSMFLKLHEHAYSTGVLEEKGGNRLEYPQVLAIVYKIVLVRAMTMCGQQSVHAFFHLA